MIGGYREHERTDFLEHPDITTIIRTGELKPDVPLYYCERCYEEIYAGYEYFSFADGEIVCPDCKEDYIFELEQEARKIAGEGEIF